MNEFKRYLSNIALANGLGGAREVVWHFYPGMLQDSVGKWWADFGTRATCHEGIDICFFKKGTAPLTAIAPASLVPAMAGGKILNIARDLLGHSIVVSHEQDHDPGQGLPVMVYSHLDPQPGLRPGDRLKKNEILGRIFDTRKKKSKLLSHLHLSCICLPEIKDPQQLNWTLFCDRNTSFYINPVFL